MDSDEEIEAIRSLKLDHKRKPKKKKNRSRKKRIATGFEEYYADAPTTPEEALKEQQELYSSTVPFEQPASTATAPAGASTMKSLSTLKSTPFSVA
ncbi:hypothetical protein NQ176_g10968 [Zarea fungicola]|uniref:Uncharacterized protein n=1 Tax=Zarea fungicola TaxID=93591 RepID=A0ACC1MDS3_9HYPO|nr:hypothetical protein NQ176_g10968 [Lecanicillium fungicola]